MERIFVGLLAVWCAGVFTAPAFGENSAGEFLEPETLFLRTALVGKEGKSFVKVRRGVVLPIGEGRWACFDPDLLRWAAVWDASKERVPISMDSMAAVSYPDKSAKAVRPPQLSGRILFSDQESPGVSSSLSPMPDPRTATLTGNDERVGALPVSFGRWSGISVVGKTPVLHYECGGRQISETVSFEGDSFERTIRISGGTKPLAIRVAAIATKAGGMTWGELSEGSLARIIIEGDGAELKSSSSGGTWILVKASKEERLIRISRSNTGQKGEGRLISIPEGFAEPLFPEAVQVDGHKPKGIGSFEVRPMSLPIPNSWNRAVRPTDLAFSPNGDAYLCTLDGDVWKIQGIDGEAVSWTRVATGLFETTNIEINARGEIFVLGRDQITQLVDTNGDGYIDLYRNISDLFDQTLHTRDYSMSMSLAPDGAFYVAKGGIFRKGAKGFNEHSAHRGTIVRISPDGRSVKLVAEGLRLPYVGVRDDGAVFASDQQGNWVPSSPVHQIGEGVPVLGFPSERIDGKRDIIEPLLWFPYRVNRSSAGFVTFSEKGFPDLGGRFAQVSWNGNLFPLEIPKKGLPFSWKLPVYFQFPTLNAATHPITGEMFTVGLGISGYKPTTPELSGLAGLRQRKSFAGPISLEISERRIRVGFAGALPENALTTATLRLWDVKRTGAYGSGHYRWDGEAGEHILEPEKIEISSDRQSLDFIIPEIYRSEVLVLSLQMRGEGSEPSDLIELYARPSHLKKAGKRELAKVEEREKAFVNVEAGDAKRGAAVFVSYACSGCHSVDGQKLAGPPLNGIASRHGKDLDGYLRDSILRPGKVVTEGYQASMPPFSGVIPAQEMEDLIAYLKTLR